MSRRTRFGALVATAAAGMLAVATAGALVVLAPGGAAVAGASPMHARGGALMNSAPCSTSLETSMPTGPAVVSSMPTRFGRALVVGSGTEAGCSLYMLTSDSTANAAATGSTFACTVFCSTVVWPALLTTGAPMAGTGVNPTLLGAVTRTLGGTMVQQVTYTGHPLYRFSFDQTAGDTTGEQFFDPGTNLHGVWYLVSPGRGTPLAAPTTFADMTVPLAAPGATTPSPRDVLTVMMDQGLGGLPFPVYTSNADMHHMSVCGSTPACALRWPAVLTSGTPMATGTVGGMLGTVGRPPGMHQVTFDGQPLYLFFPDAYFPAFPTPLNVMVAHGTGIHPTFTGLDVGMFSLVPAP